MKKIFILSMLIVTEVLNPRIILTTLVAAIWIAGATTASAGSLTWTPAAPMLTPTHALGVVSASNGRIYAFGGANYPYNTVEEYDPAFNTWATGTPMPVGGFMLGAVGASNGKVYAIGGWGTSGWYAWLNEVYDPSVGAWDTTRAPLPSDRYDFGAAEGTDGKIYAIGGCIYGYTPLSTVEAYTPATDTWTTRAPMPTARMSGATVAASNGKIYVFGGFNGNGEPDIAAHYLATVEAYDPLTDTWTTKRPMPTARRAAAAVQAPNGKIYVIGGYIGTYVGEQWQQVYLDTVEVYDPANDTWTSDTPLPAPRGWHGAALANGAIYVIGGYDGAQILDTVEMSGPSIQSTTTTTTPPTVIELAIFTAVPQNRKVILSWSTGTEIDNAGFNLYRSESENGQYTKINTALIPAKGSSTQGASYEFSDTNVQNRKTYFYKLEDSDFNGQSTMHGPVSATPRLIWGILGK